MNNKQLAYRVCIECGMNPQHEGFQMVIDAILLVYEDRSYLHKMITKRLYPDIAKMYNSTSARVERDIRFAISSSRSPHDNGHFIGAAVYFMDYYRMGEADNAEAYAKAKDEVYDTFMFA